MRRLWRAIDLESLQQLPSKASTTAPRNDDDEPSERRAGRVGSKVRTMRRTEKGRTYNEGEGGKKGTREEERSDNGISTVTATTNKSDDVVVPREARSASTP